MSEVRPGRGRREGGAALGLGLFAAIQTFYFFAKRDRFETLFWWTSESWLLVTLLWLKDLLFAGVAFFGFASLARWTLRLPGDAVADGARFRLRHGVLLLAVLAVGIALRWIAPRQIPPSVWVDPLIEISQILRRPGASGWIGGWPRTGEGSIDTAVVSNLYLKFCELLLHVFGRGDWGILALSAVGGSLALPALYVLAREIEGARVALGATTILAFCCWPLVFSRWTWTGALMLFLVLSAAAATLAALRRRNAIWAFAAGVLLGLSLHTHPAAWAAAAAFALFALLSLRRRELRRLAPIAALGTFLSFAPLGVAFLRFPERLGGRARDVSFLSRWTDTTVAGTRTPLSISMVILHNSLQYSGLFLWTVDPNPRHGLPGRSRVHPILGIAALVGAALAWKRACDSDDRQRLLLLLAGGGLLAGVLSNPAGAPNTFRASILLAPLAIWSASVLARWISAAAHSLRAREPFLWSLALCLLLLFETDRFLRVWPEDSLVRSSFTPVETSAGRIVRRLGSGPVVLDPDAVFSPVVLETLAANPDPALPVPRAPRRRVEDLTRNPPKKPFWYVTREESLDALRRSDWRCGRGVAVCFEKPGTVIARVVPPRDAAVTAGAESGPRASQVEEGMPEWSSPSAAEGSRSRIGAPPLARNRRARARAEAD